MADENTLTNLKTVFSNPKYLFRWLVYSSLASILMAIPTALIPNPFINFVRMTPAVPIDYLFLGLTGLLMGAYFTLHGYQNQPDANPKKHFLMFGGGYLGFITFACPICEVFLVALFGAGFLLTYFEPVRHEFGVLAILVMALGIFLKARQLNNCQSCN